MLFYASTRWHTNVTTGFFSLLLTSAYRIRLAPAIGRDVIMKKLYKNITFEVGKILTYV